MNTSITSSHRAAITTIAVIAVIAMGCKGESEGNPRVSDRGDTTTETATEQTADLGPKAPICEYAAAWPASVDRIIADTALLRGPNVDSCFELVVDSVAGGIRAGADARMLVAADSVAARCDGAFSDYMADALAELFADRPSALVAYLKGRGDCHMRALLVAGLAVAMKTSGDVHADSVRAWGRRGADDDATSQASQWVGQLLRDLKL